MVPLGRGENKTAHRFGCIKKQSGGMTEIMSPLFDPFASLRLCVFARKFFCAHNFTTRIATF